MKTAKNKALKSAKAAPVVKTGKVARTKKAGTAAAQAAPAAQTETNLEVPEVAWEAYQAACALLAKDLRGELPNTVHTLSVNAAGKVSLVTAKTYVKPAKGEFQVLVINAPKIALAKRDELSATGKISAREARLFAEQVLALSHGEVCRFLGANRLLNATDENSIATFVAIYCQVYGASKNTHKITGQPLVVFNTFGELDIAFDVVDTDLHKDLFDQTKTTKKIRANLQKIAQGGVSTGLVKS